MIDDIVGGGRVFSATATWALEYGIVTAASMEARGYGVGRRTRYSPYAFKHADIVLTAHISFTFSCDYNSRRRRFI